MKKSYLYIFSIVMLVLLMSGCGNESTVSAGESTDFEVVSLDGGAIVSEGTVIELDIPEENPADNIHMHEKNNDDEMVDDTDCQSGDTSGSGGNGEGESEDGNDGEKVRTLTDVFYGYTEDELLASTVAQLINDKMGYKRNKQYPASDLTFFVPFSTSSSEMSYFSDFMNNRSLESIRGTVQNWESLSEAQKTALGGLVYSGLLPEDVFIYWGMTRDTIHAYAVKVASH